MAEIAVASDPEIVAAMRFLFERLKTVAEPSGACALAALLAGRVEARGPAGRRDDLGRERGPRAVRGAARGVGSRRWPGDVVILGGGFGGLYTARKLEKRAPAGRRRA